MRVEYLLWNFVTKPLWGVTSAGNDKSTVLGCAFQIGFVLLASTVIEIEKNEKNEIYGGFDIMVKKNVLPSS
jgi:hypothetical protein